MIYQLQSGVDNETGRKIKTASATLLITIGLPTLVALLNRIEPFLLPSVRGAFTSQTGSQGTKSSSATSDNKKDGDKSAAPATAGAQPDSNNTAADISTSNISRNISNVGVTGSTAVPSVGGYGSGPVSVSPSAQQQPITVSPDSTPTDPGECLCSTIQDTIEPVTQTVEPVTTTITDTTDGLTL